MNNGIGLRNIFFTLPAIIIVLSVHEYSHAKVADLLGDPTPRNRGRLTLNPLAHIDPLGLLMLVLVRLGWAKPVPTNPMYYKDRRKGTLYVSLAGPLSGVVLALIAAILLAVRFRLALDVPLWVIDFLKSIYLYGLIIAVFNLIPVYPLDGSRILGSLLPPKTAYSLQQNQDKIQIVFLLVVFLGNRLLWAVLNPVIGILDFIIQSITSLIY
ncbi:MAG: membrane metalloprotease [Firmicutes bacterium]|nr:membrane metalloprotease [Bacillota bacterium]